MAKEVPTIQASLRDKIGSRYSKRLRAAGRLPAVIYGHGSEPMSVHVDEHTTIGALKQGLHVINLDIDGKGTETCLVKDLQFGFMGDNVIHMDLARVNLDEIVEVTVVGRTGPDQFGDHHRPFRDALVPGPLGESLPHPRSGDPVHHPHDCNLGCLVLDPTTFRIGDRPPVQPRCRRFVYDDCSHTLRRGAGRSQRDGATEAVSDDHHGPATRLRSEKAHEIIDVIVEGGNGGGDRSAVSASVVGDP